MNDEDFIIISSDEEIDSNKISRKPNDPNTGKITEQTLHNGNVDPKIHEAPKCSKKSIVDESNNCPIKNTTGYISTVIEVKNNDKDPENLVKNAESEPEIKANDTKIDCDRFTNESSKFKKFLDLVISLEDNIEDKCKLEKKIMKYHNLANPNYVKSDEFNNELEKYMSKLNENRGLLYFIIKDVLDWLSSKRNESLGDPKTKNEYSNDEAGHDQKNYKIIKKLSKFLKKLEKKIKELEETEVDFSDEEDSTYLKMQKYRERFCQIYKKLCSYTNQAADARRIFTRKISFNGTKNIELDRAIESWLNKSKEFPDYSSVFKFMKESNESLKLDFSKQTLNTMAENVFEKIGNLLQLRRKYDFWESCSSFLGGEVEPSENDEALRQKLNENYEVASKKQTEIFDYYADLQSKNCLKPEYVPDDVANCSPMESGDEDEEEIKAAEKALNAKILLKLGHKGKKKNLEDVKMASKDEDEDEITSAEEASNSDIVVEIEDSEEDINLNDIQNCTSVESEHEDEGKNKAAEEASNSDIVVDIEDSEEDINLKDVAKCSSMESEHEDEEKNKAAAEASNSDIVVDIEESGEESNSGDNEEKNLSMDLACDDEGDADSLKLSDSTETKYNPDFLKNDTSESKLKVDLPKAMKVWNCQNAKRIKMKESPDSENSHCVKKPKIAKSDNQENSSDCEILIVLSDDETNLEPEMVSQKMKKVHQINYTFINNSFNHNAIQALEDLMLKRKSSYSCFKSSKNPRKFLPLSDLTNIKNITNTYSKFKVGSEKKKVQEPVRLHPFGRSRCRYSKFIFLNEKNNQCALENESNSENVNLAGESDQGKEGESCDGNSNGESVTPPSNGGSAGGNGEDNNEGNGNKKRSDEEKEVGDNQEEEDEKEKEEKNDGNDDDEGKVCRNEIISHEMESNGLESGGNNYTGNNEVYPPDDAFVSPEQFLCVTMDPPQPKRRSATPKVRRTANNARAHKKGKISSTSRLTTSKYPVNCVPQTGNVKTSRGRPRQTFPLNWSNMEMFRSQQKKQSTSVKNAKSDEEIVKNFLQHSPSSISIKSPRKLQLDNKPSPSIVQAIQTLSRLKSITTTVVKASRSDKRDDITMIGESPRKNKKQGNPSPSPRQRRSQSFLLPKIVTVQGNVSGFDNINSDDSTVCTKAHSPNRRKTQHVATPNNASSPRQQNTQTRQQSSKKNVEYVVLD